MQKSKIYEIYNEKNPALNRPKYCECKKIHIYKASVKGSIQNINPE